MTYNEAKNYIAEAKYFYLDISESDLLQIQNSNIWYTNVMGRSLLGTLTAIDIFKESMIPEPQQE